MITDYDLNVNVNAFMSRWVFFFCVNNMAVLGYLKIKIYLNKTLDRFFLSEEKSN